MTLDSLNPMKSRASSLLGLTVEGRRLEGVILRRAKDGVDVDRSLETSLTLDPLTNEPALVGQEIRNRLDEAEVRETRCVVGIPLSWAMTLQVKLPEIPEQDMASYLGIQAERGFPYSPDDLSIATSRCTAPNGERFATLVAIPKGHLTRLEQVLAAARLKPVSFSLAIAALQPPGSEKSEGVLTLVAGEYNVDLQVTCGGGLVTLRALQGAVEMDGADRKIDIDLLTRELRLTLGQLPKEFRETITRIRIFGRPEWRQPLADAVAPGAKRLGLPLETRSVAQADGIGVLVPPQPNASPALAMAVRFLGGDSSTLEFLPPKVSRWDELASRFSSRRVFWTTVSAGAAVFLILTVVLAQYIRLSVLESRWHRMEPKVTELESIQENIRKFRPWCDDAPRTLAILRRLTEVFPEDGAVTAKTIEIKELAEVTCTGTAQDNQAWLKMSDRLKAASHVDNVQLVTMTGRSPIRFTFNFRWTEGGNP